MRSITIAAAASWALLLAACGEQAKAPEAAAPPADMTTDEMAGDDEDRYDGVDDDHTNVEGDRAQVNDDRADVNDDRASVNDDRGSVNDDRGSVNDDR